MHCNLSLYPSLDITQTVNSPLLNVQTAKRKIPPTTTAPVQAVTSPVLETPTDSHPDISMQVSIGR